MQPATTESDELATRASTIPRSWVTVVGTDVRIGERDGAVFATIHLDDVEAAHGQAALAGTTAVIDRIKTDPDYRRRGLGWTSLSPLTTFS